MYIGNVAIVADASEAPDRESAPLLCAAFAGLPARIADIVGTLPLVDANAALLRTLDAWPIHDSTVPCYVGVLAVDPFWRSSDLIAELLSRDVSGVINLPSLGVLDGTYRDAMATMNFCFDAELAFLQQAIDHGLRAAALVRSLAQARAAVQHGVRTLVLHPGLPRGEHLTNRQLAVACATTVRQLQNELELSVDVLVFRHPDLWSELESAVGAADGVVTYNVRADPMPDTS